MSSDVTCKLCLGPGPLRSSHIIPEFLHAPLYDEKHRVTMHAPCQRTEKRFLQKGLRDNLLCDGCEQLLNEAYEKPFKAEWRPGRLLPERPLEPRGTYRVSGLDYAKIKLFLLSILFRAGASERPEFETVDLGPYQERLRLMVHRRDPGEPGDFPIIGILALNDLREVLFSTTYFAPCRMRSHRTYAVQFGGCEWTFFVSGQTVDLGEFGIRPDGSAVFGSACAGDLVTTREMREAIAARRVRPGHADRRQGHCTSRHL